MVEKGEESFVVIVLKSIWILIRNPKYWSLVALAVVIPLLGLAHKLKKMLKYIVSGVLKTQLRRILGGEKDST